MRAVSRTIHCRRDRLQASLAKGEALTPEDERWLDNDANLVDEIIDRVGDIAVWPGRKCAGRWSAEAWSRWKCTRLAWYTAWSCRYGGIAG